MQKYSFYWNLLGDINLGRPNLGSKIDLDVYRLSMFTLRDVIERSCGTEETDRIFMEAGKIAGTEFYRHYIHPVNSVEEFVSKTQEVLKEKSIGILRIEEAEMNDGKVVLTIDEDVDCSGLPEQDFEICVYDEGFVAALFESFTNDGWNAKEIDCWCTGARTCRFLVQKTNKE